MSNVSRAIERIQAAIEGKAVLEVACGSAEFSIEAAKTAAKVCCIDVDAKRVPANLDGKIEFTQMDAAQMTFAADSFDTVVIYNGMAYLEDVLGRVMAECRRVVKPEGAVYIISTWMMDRFVIEQALLPALVEAKTGMGHTRMDVDGVAIVEIR